MITSIGTGMYNKTDIEGKIAFYNQPRFVDDPFHPNGFKGTWAFSSHDLIPDVFAGFIQRYFGQYNIRRVPLEKINSTLNELWEGPGSLEKIFRLERELKEGGKSVVFSAADIASIKAKKSDEEEEELFEIEDLDIGFGNLGDTDDD